MIGTDLSIIAPIAAEKVPHGLVFGKFMPPTLGHQYLCDVARASCDKLTIIVGTLPDEPIPGYLRHQWMTEMYPGCDVIHLDKVMPQAPDHPEHKEFFQLWADTLYAVSEHASFDALFASEPYGYKVAEAMGISFIPVDTARQSVKISATEIRNNPIRHWNKLPSVVRPYFVKRVRLAGGALEERQCIAERLAVQFDTVYVDDAETRLYADFKRNLPDYPGMLRDIDMPTAARLQQASATALARQARGVMFLISEGDKADLEINITGRGIDDIVAELKQAFPDL